MTVLYIAIEPIYPSDTGSRIRDYQLVKAISGKHRVEVAYIAATAMPPEARPPYAAAHHIPLDKPLSGLSAFDKALLLLKAAITGSFPLARFFLGASQLMAIRHVIDQSSPQIIVLQSSYLLPLAAIVKRHYPSITMVLDAHNIEWQLQWRMAQTAGSALMRPVKQWMASNLRRWEKSADTYVSAIAAVSQKEAEWWQEACPKAKVSVVPNGVDIDFFKPTCPLPTDPVISFCGSMSYLPNHEGVLWFYQSVWPLLQAKLPHIRWLIIGKDPEQEVKALASDAITVTGRVDDVRGWLEQSRLSVVPLLAGGGTRLKILEAMSMERVVVSTSIGAEGIASSDGLIIADTPEQMSQAIIDMLANTDLHRLGRENRQVAIDQYSWQAIGEGMVELVESVYAGTKAL